MYFSRGRALRLRTALLTAGLLLGACARRQPPPLQRLAILRFENLTPDPATDWIGRAMAEAITTELTGSAGIYAIPSARLHTLNQAMGPRPVAAPGISAEAALAQAVDANRFGYGEYAIVGGRLRARLTIEDPETRRVAQGPIEVSVDSSDPIGAASAIAKQISAGAKPFQTANTAAFQAYVLGMEATESADCRRYAEQAVAADPNFGQGYVLLVETALKQGDRAGAIAALQAAAARSSSIGEIPRIRLEILTANLRGDSEGIERALTALSQASPLDPAVWRSLGETAVARRQYTQAAAAYGRSLAIEPGDVNLWNQLGYTWAYAGNPDAAMNALRRYQALRPADPNPLDSMGDVSVLAGRLKEAEALYLEARKKNPAFLNGIDLYKAAMARLMTGDVAGADTIVGESASNTDWLWISGRRKQAYAKALADLPKIPNRDAQARSAAQLAVWALLLEDRAGADRMAAQAVPLVTPASSGPVAVSKFVTLPSASAAEWVERAGRMFPNAPPNSIKDIALAYALLLDRHFAEAIPLLRNLEARSGSGGDRSAAIELAWALIETGKMEEAAPLLRANPVPGVDSASAFAGLYFPRLFELRARVADRAGKADEARENRRIYAALGGQ